MYRWSEVDGLCEKLANHVGEAYFEIVANDEGEVSRVVLLMNSDTDGPSVWNAPVECPITTKLADEYIKTRVQYLERKRRRTMEK